MSKRIISIMAVTAISCMPVFASAEESTCASNFTTQGSFLSGKQYKTWQDYSTVPQADAFKRVYAALVKDGWKIGQSDKEVGVISASQEVSYGGGKAAPLNILVETNGAGSKVTATFSTSGGVSAKAKAVQQSLCSYLNAAAAS